MKNSHTVRSSVFSVFLLFTFITPSTYAQTLEKDHRPINVNEFPTAKVGVIKESNTTWYSFKIIHEIPEWKAERLEERLALRYSDIQSIEIDALNNTVKMELLNGADVQSITRILYHFKFNGYEEL